jgi:hypothetical protein
VTGNQLNVKVMERGYFSLPFRAAFSSKTMFLPRGHRIETYDISTKSLIDSAYIQLPDVESNITAVHVISEFENGIEIEKYIAFSHKTSFTGIGSFSLFDIGKKQIVGTAEIGINPQMIRAFINLQGEMEILVLCEGTFGGKNSTLYRLLPTPMMAMPFNISFFELGDTGNHFDIVDQLALTLMNGSHEVIAIDLATNRVLPGSFSVGTEGYDGPRELLIDPSTNQVFISTYASDIRVGSLEDGSMLDSKVTNGKAEGMAIIEGNLWVCNIFKKDDYAVDSVLNIFPIGITSSILDEYSTLKNIGIHGGTLSISMIGEYPKEVEIINASGNIVMNAMINGDQNTFSLAHLPHGLYGISIHSGGKAQKFVIIHSER